MKILIGFAPNPANPRKIRWWPCCYAWWPDEFLGNFSFLSFTDENRTYHSIDIWSDSTGDEIGGVTINSLDVGNIATLDHLSGITLCFDSNDDSTSELGESVFWENANDTLEIESLSITFGKLEYGAMHVSLEANCFTYAPHKDITVTVIALARIVP